MLRELCPHLNNVVDSQECMFGDMGRIVAVGVAPFLKWAATEDVEEILEMRDEEQSGLVDALAVDPHILQDEDEG